MEEIGGALPQRPINCAGDVYSNFDHEIDNRVVFELQAGDCFAFHTAWAYCGNVWFIPETRTWVEQVDIYQATVDYIVGRTIEEVIEKTIYKYGRG